MGKSQSQKLVPIIGIRFSPFLFSHKVIIFSMNSTYKPMPTSQTPDTSQIESKFREALSGQSALSGYSLPELNLFLKMLDPMMIRDIDRAMESYQAKKEPILEVCLILE